jgi:hypothetical protein
MVAVPAATPVTTPEVALTVAMLAELLDQEPPLTVEVRVDVPLTQMFWVPLRVPAMVEVTVTVRVSVAFEQPPVPLTVYVMVAVPAVIPVTRPEVALTVATAGVLLDQAPPEMVEVKLDVPFTQMPCVPLSVPADGVAVTVTVRVAVAFEQPPVPVMV